MTRRRSYGIGHDCAKTDGQSPARTRGAIVDVER